MLSLLLIECGIITDKKCTKISADSCKYKLRIGLEKWISQEVPRDQSQLKALQYLDCRSEPFQLINADGAAFVNSIYHFICVWNKTLFEELNQSSFRPFYFQSHQFWQILLKHFISCSWKLGLSLALFFVLRGVSPY